MTRSFAFGRLLCLHRQVLRFVRSMTSFTTMPGFLLQLSVILFHHPVQLQHVNVPLVCFLSPPSARVLRRKPPLIMWPNHFLYRLRIILISDLFLLSCGVTLSLNLFWVQSSWLSPSFAISTSCKPQIFWYLRFSWSMFPIRITS